MIKNETVNPALPKWLIDEMLAYLYSRGLVLKNKEFTGVVHVPVVVYPSYVVKSFFDKIGFYQIAFNKLIDKMSRDQEFIHSTLGPLTENNIFLKRNLEISAKCPDFPLCQKIQLGIFRNDYMIDKFKKFIYQIEYNTIAATMGFFSDGMKQFFSYFSKKYPEYFERYFNNESKKVLVDKENTIDTIGDSMIEAIKLLYPENYQTTMIVFVVQKDERNEYDQRAIENYLWDKFGVLTRRLTLGEVAQVATYDSNSNLIVDNKIVSLFYFRAGYVEKDYPDEESWKGREMIELSTAIKCPNINTFLCTFKIFQYQLQKPEVLKKYLNDELIINDLLRFFSKIYFAPDLDNDARKNLFTEIVNNYSKFIVKPQKEGGGNNFYNDSIAKLIPSPECEMNDILKTSIIVERIYPPEFDTTVLVDNQCKIASCVSEVSVYGIVISDDKSILSNKNVGFLLRTKDKTSEEGGVIIGVSAIDLPCLVDMKFDSASSMPISYD